MSDPFYPAKSGDPILADTWNNMQIKTRDEIRAHTHKGSDDGRQLDGDSISATAWLKVSRVDAAVSLSVAGVDLASKLTALDTQKLALAGGNLTGALSVTANVGIGAAAGTKRLLVVAPGGGNNAALELRNSGDAAGWGIGAVIRTTGGTEGAGLVLRSRAKSWQLRGEQGAASTGLQITEDGGDVDTGSGLGTPRIHIKAGGSVGLNTTDPQGALDIRLSGAAAGFDRFVVNTTNDWGAGGPHVTIGAGGGSGLMVNNPHVVWHKTENRASIRYGLSGGVATGLFWDVGARVGNAFSFIVNGTQTMWMGADGSVGIGTTTATPGVRLDVQGGSLRVSGAIMPSIGNANGNGIQFPEDAWGGTGDAAFIRYYRVPNPLPGEEENGRLVIACTNEPGDSIIFNQSGADRMTMVNGFIGVGTPRPSTPLHILQQASNSGLRIQENGSGRFMDICYEGQGNFHLFHSNGLGQWMQQDGIWRGPSDASLKDNITSLQDVLPRVLALRPVSFNWKNTGDLNLGLVAQEVEAVFPELVSELKLESAGGKVIKGLAHQAFSVLAIAALKELKQQYDERLAALEQRLQNQELKS
ncbi:tail fiber domain-containing protein [Myxococcus sp. AM011]|uniref:tail fiber domain-containing protein n=1 Tax=Myxococcus sp. AM011 TaxID=2745200 RepID=UPI0015957E69|nr:tail fiber domain-containing protein [Myxococcus sp. AM011]NVJ25051.1 tail fiber domain-containing protein [Myxococcus sp. AM011]